MEKIEELRKALKAANDEHAAAGTDVVMATKSLQEAREREERTSRVRQQTENELLAEVFNGTAPDNPVCRGCAWEAQVIGAKSKQAGGGWHTCGRGTEEQPGDSQNVVGRVSVEG